MSLLLLLLLYGQQKQQAKACCMQGEVQQLKQSNTTLSQRLALHEVEGPRSPHPRPPLKQMPVPSQTAALPEGRHPAEAKHEQASQLQLDSNKSFQEQLHSKLPKVTNWPLIAMASSSIPPWSRANGAVCRAISKVHCNLLSLLHQGTSQDAVEEECLPCRSPIDLG